MVITLFHQLLISGAQAKIEDSYNKLMGPAGVRGPSLVYLAGPEDPANRVQTQPLKGSFQGRGVIVGLVSPQEMTAART